MMDELAPGVRAAMENHARSAPDSEVCGLVYQDIYVPLTNVSAEPHRDFHADPAQLAKALSVYGEPVAVFHTHPSGSRAPSAADRQSYYINSMIIIGVVCNGVFEAYAFGAPAV